MSTHTRLARAGEGLNVVSEGAVARETGSISVTVGLEGLPERSWRGGSEA